MPVLYRQAGSRNRDGERTEIRYSGDVSGFAAPLSRSDKAPLHSAPGWMLAAAAVLPLFSATPAIALDFFAEHQVTAQFATPDGTPMAGAEVRVFAPGDPINPAETGRTDKAGKFVFDADRDGMWSAEARTPDRIARIMIRVGGKTQPHASTSPIIVIGTLAVLALVLFWYRLRRARARRPEP
jgi:hypothetical protein